jgi:Uma2 family endonuclease
VPYKDREPWGDDVLLLIEVADTSLRYDRTTKLAVYAEAGIPEYWIVDCTAESIEIHRGPEGGRYRDVTRVAGVARSVSPQAFPDIALTLAEIFA